MWHKVVASRSIVYENCTFRLSYSHCGVEDFCLSENRKMGIHEAAYKVLNLDLVTKSDKVSEVSNPGFNFGEK